MRRRAFLKSALLCTSCFSLFAQELAATLIARPEQALIKRWQRWLASCIDHEASFLSIEKAYRTHIESEIPLVTFYDRASKKMSQQGIAPGGATKRQFGRVIAELRRDDFLQNSIIQIDGWMLAEIEVLGAVAAVRHDVWKL